MALKFSATWTYSLDDEDDENSAFERFFDALADQGADDIKINQEGE